MILAAEPRPRANMFTTSAISLSIAHGRDLRQRRALSGVSCLSLCPLLTVSGSSVDGILSETVAVCSLLCVSLYLFPLCLFPSTSLSPSLPLTVTCTADQGSRPYLTSCSAVGLG